MEKDVALRLNKLEFSSPKDAFCLVWLNGSGEEYPVFLNFIDENVKGLDGRQAIIKAHLSFQLRWVKIGEWDKLFNENICIQYLLDELMNPPLGDFPFAKHPSVLLCTCTWFSESEIW